MSIGMVIALIKKLATTPDPEVITGAVDDYLEEHPEATCPIDDTAGEGDTGKVWSADKAAGEIASLTEAITPLTPAATSGDVGKFLKAKTVSGGKVTEYEFGSAGGGGGGGVEIDDTAGIGDTTVTWSANKSASEIANLIPDAPETISWIDKTYINSSGVAETDNDYEATDYIDITDAVAISYAGRMGSSKVCFWYNSSKTFLSSALVLDDRTAYYENVMTYKPENAKYLRLQSKKTTATNPPAVTPEVTVFYDPKYVERLAENIVGDGATDDTNAVQRIVNVGEFVKFPRRDRILITGTIDVRMGYARILDGNGCNIVVDDDFYALTVTGTLTGATEATGMPVRVVEDEAAMLIKNFRITSEDITEGGGIQITKSFRAKLCDNYIHHMKNGIRVYGQNRDMIISNNQMITFTNNGILFDQGINLHQCNIFGNMLTYAHDVICIDQPQAIANFQITGNDIEILNYPASTYGTAKCIYFKSVSNCQQFSEIEIVGNSIQGHGTSAFIIALDGVASYEIKNVAICGNHISNSNDCAISLKNVQNITINGNNYAEIKHFVYELDGTCENIMVSGESGIGINEGTVAAGGKLHAASTATLSGVKCKNVQFSNDTVSIETSGLTNVDVWDEKDITVSAPSATIIGVPNERYVFGEVSTLSFTPCSKGVCGVVFTSGSTPTTLTIPNTVKWSDDFDPSDLDASTTYELSILNGTMGVAAKWA